MVVWSDKMTKTGEPSFVQPSFLNPAGELARRLLAVAPAGMAYVTFANSGAEAIEAAIKLCRSTTGRPCVLSASNGFHGNATEQQILIFHLASLPLAAAAALNRSAGAALPQL